MSHDLARSAQRRGRRSALLTCLAVATALTTLQLVVSSSPSFARSPAAFNTNYPSGIRDTTEPSGVAPPASGAMVGYRLRYVTEFTGTKLPPGWDVFTGVPGGDPWGRFAASHVVVSNGVLALNTWRDPAYQNRWIIGGLCQCGVARLYGAYFVRSRVTGAGPSEIQLLWPLTNQWPPEIDFNETLGSISTTTASIHYSPANKIASQFVHVNLARWHTWGVIWTASSVIYTVDGRVWGAYNVAANLPRVTMTLDFEQRALCERHRECPTAPQSMYIDWVAEYTKG